MSPEARRQRLLLGTAALALLAGPVLPAQRARTTGWLELESHAGERGALWSVVASEVTPAEVVEALARRAGLALEGGEMLPREARLSIELAARPLDEVLAIVLGTSGLRAELGQGSVRVQAEPGESAARLVRADAAWAELERHGDGRARSAARLARGALAEARGDEPEARSLYARALEQASAEPLTDDDAHELLYRLGRLSARQGEWSTAARHFRRLLESPGAERFQARARLALARALLELGDPSAASDALAASDVTGDACAVAERRLLLARARMASAQPIEALRALDDGPAAPLPAVEARTLAVRAEALATLGHPTAAARAWLLFAREGARGAERASALTRAAELAREEGDALAILFLCREAERLGLGSALASFAALARRELGLEPSDAALPFEERLALAEALLAKDPARAGELLDGLAASSASLSDAERASLLVARARLVARTEGSGPALALLSDGRATLPAEQRPVLDRAAASLLEAEGRFDAAVQAYEGEY